MISVIIIVFKCPTIYNFSSHLSMIYVAFQIQIPVPKPNLPCYFYAVKVLLACKAIEQDT